MPASRRRNASRRRGRGSQRTRASGRRTRAHRRRSRRRLRGGNGLDQFNNSGGVVTGLGTYSGINQGVSTLLGNNYLSSNPAIQPTGSNYYKPMI